MLNHMLLGAGCSWMTIISSYFVLMFVVRDARQFQVAIAVGGLFLRLIFLGVLFAWLGRVFRIDLAQVIVWLVAFYLVLVIYEGFDMAAEARKPKTEA